MVNSSDSYIHADITQCNVYIHLAGLFMYDRYIVYTIYV